MYERQAEIPRHPLQRCITGPYPDHLLKRVDRPTNEIPGPVQRLSYPDHILERFLRGELGEELREGMEKMSLRYPLGAALVDLQVHLNTYAEKRIEVAPERAPIPDDPRVLSRHLKSLGYFLGADLVGIGKLRSSVYTEDIHGDPIEADYSNAIVCLARKSEPSLAAANGWEHIVDPASWGVYHRSLWISEVIANYLRRLGIDAVPEADDVYLTLMPPLILEAGLGEVSRMGIIVNPFLGANFKAGAVLTNLELELDGCVDFGLQDFCLRCRNCADHCPPGAIPRGKKTLHNGYYTWKPD